MLWKGCRGQPRPIHSYVKVNPSFLILIFILHASMVCLLVRMLTHAKCPWRPRERATESLELELWTAVVHHVGAGN